MAGEVREGDFFLTGEREGRGKGVRRARGRERTVGRGGERKGEGSGGESEG